MKFRIALIIAAIMLLITGAAFAEQSGDWTYELTPSGLTITGYTGSAAEVVIPDEIDGYLVTNIGRHAFMENYNLQIVTIPVGVSSIQAEAFYGCSALSVINFNARDCVVPEIWCHDSNKGVGVFGGAGSASPSGLTVVFGPEVTRVPDWLFATASMPEGNGHTGYPYCYVTDVIFSDSVEVIGDHAFRNCQKLKGVTLGSGVTTIETSAFQSCISAESLVATDALTYIHDYAFLDCTGLEAIQWGAGLDYIGYRTFWNCTSLTELVLPEPMTSLGTGAFGYCLFY